MKPFQKSRLGVSKIVCIAALLMLVACAKTILESHERQIGAPLVACSSKPNCVNSEGDSEHLVAPLRVVGDLASAWQVIRQQVMSSKRTTVVFEQQDYLHAEVVSPLGFYTDDLALRLDAENGVVHVRSSSRLGYYDFGVNADRVEALRAALVEAGVISP